MKYKNQLLPSWVSSARSKLMPGKNLRPLYLISLFILIGFKSFSVPIYLTSPDKRITVTIDLRDKIFYDVKINGDPIISNAYLQLNLDDQKLGEKPRLIGKTFSAVNTRSNPVVPLKNSTVINNYNLLRLIKDGINADRQAMDFKQLIEPLKAGDAIDIHMVKDGGFVARIEPTE
ncbi:MAG: alpha-glucosidase [Mucilaginibacter sp.]|nr:alpha-glucosidase [Mucilaginibacter sp.]